MKRPFKSLGRKEHVIFYDGECKLCQSSVQFIRRRDPQGFFHFCTQQSPEGRERLLALGQDPDARASLVYWDGHRAHQRSDAALRIARCLPGMWPVFSALLVLPRFLRDPFYDFIARHRYRWFGRA